MFRLSLFLLAASIGLTMLLVPRFDWEEKVPKPDDEPSDVDDADFPDGSIAAMIPPRMMMIKNARPMRNA